MRVRTLLTLITMALVAVAAIAATASAHPATLAQVRQHLRHAQQRQAQAGERQQAAAADLDGARQLAGQATAAAPAQTTTAPAGMDAAVAAALLADGVVTPDEIAALQKRLDKQTALLQRWTAKVHRLRGKVRQLKQIAVWDRRGDWKPLIAIAAREYGVNAGGLYHMMMLESGGQRTADSGPYHGLYQFMDREWASSWNRWRDQSIYDGWAQIQLAALAIGRGMGPSIWPLTYRMSF